MKRHNFSDVVGCRADGDETTRRGDDRNHSDCSG